MPNRAARSGSTVGASSAVVWGVLGVSGALPDARPVPTPCPLLRAGRLLAVLHKSRYDALMSSVNPRLSVTLEPSTAARLRRMSELTKNSQSRLVAELLEQSAPVFDRVITVLEAAEVALDEAKRETSISLDKAQTALEQQLGLVLDTFDEGARPLLEEAEKIVRRRRSAATARAPAGRALRSASDDVLTPLSNRGVRLTRRKGKKVAASRGSGAPGLKSPKTEKGAESGR